MNQKLVTKKNRKVRTLRELYPDIRCKVFYQRDYVHLLHRYGLDEEEDAETLPPLSRIPGPPQVTPHDEASA